MAQVKTPKLYIVPRVRRSRRLMRRRRKMSTGINITSTSVSFGVIDKRLLSTHKVGYQMVDTAGVG